MRMTRRLHTDRMLRRVRETRAAELLRASGEEVRQHLTDPEPNTTEPKENP